MPHSEHPGQCIGVQSSPDPLRPGDVETATANNDSSPEPRGARGVLLPDRDAADARPHQVRALI